MLPMRNLLENSQFLPREVRDALRRSAREGAEALRDYGLDERETCWLLGPTGEVTSASSSGSLRRAR